MNHKQRKELLRKVEAALRTGDKGDLTLGQIRVVCLQLNEEAYKAAKTTSSLPSFKALCDNVREFFK